MVIWDLNPIKGQQRKAGKARPIVGCTQTTRTLPPASAHRGEDLSILVIWEKCYEKPSSDDEDGCSPSHYYPRCLALRSSQILRTSPLTFTPQKAAFKNWPQHNERHVNSNTRNAPLQKSPQTTGSWPGLQGCVVCGAPAGATATVADGSQDSAISGLRGWDQWNTGNWPYK